MRHLLSTIIFCTLSFSTLSQEFLPSVLLKLDSSFSHHVIVAEKASHKVYIYKNKDGVPTLLKSFQMATGKKSGDKLFQGDFRTPEGIYNMTSFLTHENLVERHGKEGEIYGVGAFVLDYPNKYDQLQGKTGSGIWIHSTNDETRIEKGLDSRGCVVTANSDLIEISKYIELNRTPVVITHRLTYLPKETWLGLKTELSDILNNWLKSWQEENIQKYLTFYDPEKFFDKNRGRFNNFAQYKKAVFASPGKPMVQAKDISILSVGKYAIINFKQIYQSKTIQDTGKKTLTLVRDSYYKWKIINESWTKAGIEEDRQLSSFTPSMRFFKTENPYQILNINAAKQGKN